MSNKKRILLKLTGELFVSSKTKQLAADAVNHLIDQVKQLQKTHQFGIVIGGGNFFRGNVHGKQLGITPSIGHQIGMLATTMNGLILKNLLEQKRVTTSLFCAIPSPEVGAPISQQAIMCALRKEHILVFTGGTGNPFFTTDTNAIVRGLQINAVEIWKGTKVDGVYNSDPATNKNAQLLKTVLYKDALQQKLRIMDSTAFALAEQHKQVIRVFNIFEENSLLKAANNTTFGSTITST